LDLVEKNHSPGHGAAMAGLSLTPDRLDSVFTLESRLSSAVSGYANAWAGYNLPIKKFDYGASAGLRVRW